MGWSAKQKDIEKWDFFGGKKGPICLPNVDLQDFGWYSD
jgi:hypothetical protein